MNEEAVTEQGDVEETPVAPPPPTDEPLQPEATAEQPAATVEQPELAAAPPERPRGDRGGPAGPPRGERSGPGERRRRPFGRRRVCAFCVEKAHSIDYKDPAKLRRYLSDRARIEPRRKTGTCAKHQRWLSTALKRARHLALLPYTQEHVRLTGVFPSRR